MPLPPISALKVTSVLDPIAKEADCDGTVVDLLGYHDVAFYVHFGLSAATLSGTVKIEAQVQHCNDNSTWVACPNADLSSYVTGSAVGTFALVDAAAEDEQIYSVQYVGTKRYVKLVIKFIGTHTAVPTPISAFAIRRPINIPV
jgi:hypothetical protein